MGQRCYAPSGREIGLIHLGSGQELTAEVLPECRSTCAEAEDVALLQTTHLLRCADFTDCELRPDQTKRS